LGGISERAQRHWQQYAIADDDEVPEWRLRRDLHVEFIDSPSDPIDCVRGAIQACHESAAIYCGEPLFSSVEGMNEQRVAALHTPLTDSFPEFQQQVTSLAILLVDHLNAAFFKAVDASDGVTLNGLAQWLASTFELADEEAKDEIGGLYAVLSVRSSGGGAHRAGSQAPEVLARAGIDVESLPEGFEVLANRAADSLTRLQQRLQTLDPITPESSST
jgi:hypothetical protein